MAEFLSLIAAVPKSLETPRIIAGCKTLSWGVDVGVRSAGPPGRLAGRHLGRRAVAEVALVGEEGFHVPRRGAGHRALPGGGGQICSGRRMRAFSFIRITMRETKKLRLFAADQQEASKADALPLQYLKGPSERRTDINKTSFGNYSFQTNSNF